MHFIGGKDTETSLCSLTMECGPSCNLLPLSSTWHHREGSPLHFLDRLVTERSRKTWTQGHDHESCCSFCWEDMQSWPESFPTCVTRGNQLEKSPCATGEQPLDVPQLSEFTGLFRSWIYTVFWWNETERVSHGQSRSHEPSSIVLFWPGDTPGGAPCLSAGLCQVISSHCRWKQLSLGKPQGFLTCENLMLRRRLRNEVTLSPHKALPVWLE